MFTIPEPEQSQVITAYVAAVDRVFLIGVPSAFIAALGSLIMKRVKVKMESAAVGP